MGQPQPILLDVNELGVRFRRSKDTVYAVNGLSFQVRRGERLAIVGESGCGKTVTCLSILGLNAGADVSGSITFDGNQILTMSEAALRGIRGRRIAMVSQDPTSALNPVTTVGKQMIEIIRRIHGVSRDDARDRVVARLREMSVPSPEERLSQYPHQLSGGTNQRIMLAIALACEPELLIADEPTGALDATVQQQLVQLLTQVSEQREMAVLCVTHNLGLVRRLADRVLVIYHGMLMEVGPVTEVLQSPRHPYSKALISASRLEDAEHLVVQGESPSPLDRIHGCPYAARCQDRVGPACDKQMPRVLGTEVAVRCHWFDEEVATMGTRK